MPDFRPHRRHFLQHTGLGFGALALASLLYDERLLADPRDPLAPHPGHHPAKARSVIWLFMEGGPSGFDLFDPKPELQARDGQRLEGLQTHFGNPGPLLKSPFSFRQHGQSGAWVCDDYSHIAECVDDIAFVKSVWSESANHSSAMYQMNTGKTIAGFPSTGSWVTYGLGSENRDFPGYVVLPGGVCKGGPNNWGSGFLPGAFQGTLLRGEGPPILNLRRPEGVSGPDQRAMLDLAADLNAEHQKRFPLESDLSARVSAFELAYRMQVESPGLLDLSQESDETRRLYGLDHDASRRFGRKCLLARRLVERGVRFIQVYSDDEWDAHGNILKNHRDRCRETDVPIAGLLKDLKRRGLLDETLVIWGGEFGRMPISQGGKGRDHNPFGFVVWLAGGGIQGGVSYGATDELGLKAAVNPVSVPDLHATILHLLGLDHTRLTYAHNGRLFRLTDVSGEVVTPILA